MFVAIELTCIGFMLQLKLPEISDWSESFHHRLALKLPHHHARTPHTNPPNNANSGYRRLRVESIDNIHRRCAAPLSTLT